MELYAEPQVVTSADGCYFYHTMDIPGHGLVTGDWDLRAGVDDYLGHEDFQGKRVLEIGPASGFITFEMERRGADVVSVELSPDVGWDLAPYPPDILVPYRKQVSETQPPLKRGYWFAHRAHKSRAKVHYGNAYSLPGELGKFDIAVMSDVLLHTRAPL